jgi:hypothetical protein
MTDRTQAGCRNRRRRLEMIMLRILLSPKRQQLMKRVLCFIRTEMQIHAQNYERQPVAIRQVISEHMICSFSASNLSGTWQWRLLLPGMWQHEEVCTALYSTLISYMKICQPFRNFCDPKGNKNRPWCTLHCNGIDPISPSAASPLPLREGHRV